MKLNQLCQVALSSSDLQRAITFYRDTLGMDFIAEFSPPGLAFFRMGTTRLLIEAGSVNEAAPAGGGGVLYFAVDDIQAAHAELVARGVTFESPPHLIFRDDTGTFGRKGVETWMAFFEDPDGNVLAITQER